MVRPLDEGIRPEGLAGIRAILRRGGVLGIPTDTLYGLATDPFSEAGVARIHELKGRPASKAMPVLVAETGDLSRLGVVAPPALLELLASLWPAPLTVVLPVSRPFAATSGLSSVAVRIPAFPALRELLRSVGPLTATSANPSGGEPASTAAEVERIFGGGLDLVLDGGPSPEGGVSTLVDATISPPRILRKGRFKWLESH